jgi:hypothetical protein
MMRHLPMPENPGIGKPQPSENSPPVKRVTLGKIKIWTQEKHGEDVGSSKQSCVQERNLILPYKNHRTRYPQNQHHCFHSEMCFS